MNRDLTHLQEATNTLIEAHTNLYAAQLHLNSTKRTLTATESILTTRGLEGKNEAARKAELATKCATEQASVDTAENELLASKLELTIAELEYRFAREAAALTRAELLATTNHD